MALIEINWRPGPGRLRGFGAAGAVIFGAVGAWAFFGHRLFGFQVAEATARGAAAVLWVAAAVCGVLALAAPRALRPLYLGLSLAGAPIGFLLSFLVLGAVYYLVLTPIGLVMRLLGHDPLHRRFDPGAATYWIRRRAGGDDGRHFRQF